MDDGLNWQGLFRKPHAVDEVSAKRVLGIPARAIVIVVPEDRETRPGMDRNPTHRHLDTYPTSRVDLSLSTSALPCLHPTLPFRPFQSQPEAHRLDDVSEVSGMSVSAAG